MPFREQETNTPTHKLRQVSENEAGVLSRELDLTTEGEVVANEHAGAGNDTCWELLVVAVTQTEDPAIVVTGFLRVNLHQTKIPHAIVRQAVGLGADAKKGGFEGLLDRGDEFVMRDRAPGLSGLGSGNLADVFQIHMASAAVKDEVGCAALNNDWGRGGCISDHSVL